LFTVTSATGRDVFMSVGQRSEFSSDRQLITQRLLTASVNANITMSRRTVVISRGLTACER